MENNEIDDKQAVGKFTKKFIENYIIGAILIGIVVSVIGEFLAGFLSGVPLLIVKLIITILGLWKISTSAVETSLKEISIVPSNFNNALRNIYIFLIILLAINVIVSFGMYMYSVSVLGSLAKVFTSSIIAKIIVVVIQYIAVMVFCKIKLKKMVLGEN